MKIETPLKIETGEEEYLENLAERVNKQIKGGENFYEACRLVFNSEGIKSPEAKKYYMKEIGRILGEHSAAKRPARLKEVKKEERPGADKDFLEKMGQRFEEERIKKMKEAAPLFAKEIEEKERRKKSNKK
jgi:hypothetical protein